MQDLDREIDQVPKETAYEARCRLAMDSLMEARERTVADHETKNDGECDEDQEFLSALPHPHSCWPSLSGMMRGFRDRTKELPEIEIWSATDVKFSHEDARQFKPGPDAVIAADAAKQNAKAKREEQEKWEELEAAYEKAKQLLPGRDPHQLSEGPVNVWSGHLSIGVFNLGNMTRMSWIYTKESQWATMKRRSQDVEYSMLLAMLEKAPNHIILLCEGAGMERPDIQQRMKAHGWITAHSEDTNMVVGARGLPETTKVNILFDSTAKDRRSGRSYADDPTLPILPEATLWYMIAEVDFGETRLPGNYDPADFERVRDGDQVLRAHMGKVRVLVYHINNKKASENVKIVRLRLRQMFLDAIRLEVDFMGGDSNAAIYKYFSSQPVASVKVSSFYVMLDHFVKVFNSLAKEVRPADAEYLRLGFQVITSNTEQMLRYQMDYDAARGTPAAAAFPDEPEFDVVTFVALNWGHDYQSYNERFRTPEKRNNRNRRSQPKSSEQEVLPHEIDFEIKTTEYLLNFNNELLWLKPEDKDWHRPLMVSVRPWCTKNMRKRRADARERRNDKRHYWKPEDDQKEDDGGSNEYKKSSWTDDSYPQTWESTTQAPSSSSTGPNWSREEEWNSSGAAASSSEWNQPSQSTGWNATWEGWSWSTW